MKVERYEDMLVVEADSERDVGLFGEGGAKLYPIESLRVHCDKIGSFDETSDIRIYASDDNKREHTLWVKADAFEKIAAYFAEVKRLDRAEKKKQRAPRKGGN